jgi:murein DD-endopeptidase MepM/ murein hydrolase activator NlpD
VILQPGETVDTIARRYGVPAAAILRANNLADASRVRPGQHLVIPAYQSGSGASVPHTNVAIPKRSAAAPTRAAIVHVVNRGDTIFSISKRYGVSGDAIERANKIRSRTLLRIGQRLTIPGVQSNSTARGDPYAPPGRRVELPAKNAGVASAPSAPEKVAAIKETAEPEPTAALGGSPQFRWPVKGRVISGFGPKPNGQQNDGINLSVPEGAEIKAAEDGVVAYSGNELKGYGNLVLVRHADGWVTAYAHNSQLLVKRGEKVKRGQLIARAGQTGGVNSPQLHFEIRRGSTPVDPAQHLSSL